MLFSIIMPAFNSGQTIDKAINSVLNQANKNWELIIIDDGSSDNTQQVVSLYLSDTRIKYFYQDNSGPGSSRNKGIKESNGDWLCFLDSDDYWSNDFLELIEAEARNSNPDVVFYNLCRIKQRGSKKEIMRLSRFSGCNKKDLISYQMTGMLEWGMTKAIRASIVKNNNLAFEKTSVAEEALFSFDVLFYSNSFSFIDKPIYFYVQNDYGQHKKGNYDPWYESVLSLKRHLDKKNCLDDYIGPLNSFAAKALTICMYRSFVNEKYTVAKKQIVSSKKRYSNDFNLQKRDNKFLDKTTRILLKLAEMKIYFPIFVASKLRRKRR